MSFSRDGRYIAAAQSWGESAVWEVESGRSVPGPAGGAKHITAVEFLPHGALLVAAEGARGMSESGACKLRLWDAARAKQLEPWSGHPGAIYGLSVSADGKLLCSCGAIRDNLVDPSGELILWDVATGAVRRRIPVEGAVPTEVALRPDGEVVAASGIRMPLTLWSTASGERLDAIESGQRYVNCPSFSPDGTVFAYCESSESDAGRVVVVKATDWTEVRTIHHGRWSYCLAFSSDGRRLLIGGDPTATIVDCSTWEDAIVLDGHRRRVTAARFSREGALVATGGADGTVKLWNIGAAN